MYIDGLTSNNLCFPTNQLNWAIHACGTIKPAYTHCKKQFNQNANNKTELIHVCKCRTALAQNIVQLFRIYRKCQANHPFIQTRDLYDPITYTHTSDDKNDVQKLTYARTFHLTIECGKCTNQIGERTLKTSIKILQYTYHAWSYKTSK